MSPIYGANFEVWEELFLKAQQGDKDAYGRFLSELYPFVKRKIQHKLGTLVDCDDVTQECLIGIHKSIATYNPQERLKPWVLGVIRHKVADHFRLLEKRKEADFREENNFPVTNSVSNTNSNIEEMQEEQVWSMVDKLPEEQKRALVLTKVSGLSSKEASKSEGISEAAFRKRVSRAYKLLRENLRQDLEENFDE